MIDNRERKKEVLLNLTFLLKNKEVYDALSKG
jgi:hypothetical protein